MSISISIVCPVFNTPAAYLRQAIASILSGADGCEIEILLVDDCSTVPETLSAVEELAAGDLRIKVIRCPVNVGPAVARRIGIDRARFAWIGFIDSDDLWHAGALLRFQAIAQELPRAEWIGSQYSILTLENFVFESAFSSGMDCSSFRKSAGPDNVEWLGGPDFTKWLIANNRFHVGAHIYRRNLLEKIAAFSDGNRFGEDWLLFVHLSKAADCAFSPHFLYVLRRQHESMMMSEASLSMSRVKAQIQVFRDPRWKGFRSPLRWALYSRLKTLAADLVVEGEPLGGLGAALRALWYDPREVGEFLLFLKILLEKSQEHRLNLVRKYARGELLADRRALMESSSHCI